jgi:hypothetical protein
VKPATDDTQRLNVYAANWFVLYLNGKRVAIEPIDFLPHNAQSGARLWQNVSCRRCSGGQSSCSVPELWCQNRVYTAYSSSSILTELAANRANGHQPLPCKATEKSKISCRFYGSFFNALWLE